MRRAFTLIEILVIVAIIAAMTTAAVVSIRAGQENARIKGSVRDAFAAIRLARSMALVSKEPSIITYSTTSDGDEICARIEVHTAKPFSSSTATYAETIDGERIALSDDVETESTKKKSKSAAKDASEASLMKEGDGQSTEDFLFAPADDEIFRGIALKVVKEGDELADFDEQRAKPKISVFSNVDFLLGKFNEAQAKKEQAAKAAEEASKESSTATTTDERQDPVSFVWEVNGRVEPHKVWFFRSGTKYSDGLCISVDRFGAVKVLSPEETK